MIILTKGGKRAERDFNLLAKNPALSSFGVTLTFAKLSDSEKWEPGAATPIQRACSLYNAKDMGIKTWVSLEPVIDPQQTLEIIRCTLQSVDMYKIGKWNHDKRANEIDWKAFVQEAVEILERHGKEYYVKEDLRAYL